MNAISTTEIFDCQHAARTLDVLLAAVARIAGPLHPGSEMADTLKLARSISGCLRNDLDALAEDVAEAEAARGRAGT